MMGRCLAVAVLSSLSVTMAAETVFPVTGGDEAIASRKAAVAALMALDEAALVALVPTQSGIYFTDCPNCDGGAQDHANWEWSLERPTAVRCRDCGEVYPGNARYPETGETRVEAPQGEHRYPYYERADGYRIYLRAHADYLAREYLTRHCQTLAELYRLTGEEAYARRAALLLGRFAEVFPGYACKFDYPFRQKLFTPWHTPTIEGIGPYRVSKWTWWAYMDVSTGLLAAYESLRPWEGLDRLGDGGFRSRIEKDLLTGMVDYVLVIPETYTNMSPVAWNAVIQAGRVLGRPEWIGEALQRADVFMRQQFLYDGHWQETAPSYCQQTVGLMRSFLAVLKGYEPAPAARQDQEAVLARVRSALAALEAAHGATRLPNGGLITVNDTWATAGRAPSRVRSQLLPGMGLATLVAGEDDDQAMVWLNYTAGRGHKHNDALSMALVAFQRELWRDLGYTHTAWRAWSVVTASHNTVVVDGVDSAIDGEHRQNRLRAYVTAHPRLGLVEAEHDGAYAGRCSRYRRTLLMVGAAATEAYVVDVFQVHGGAQHDWLLHGSAEMDSTLAVHGCDLEAFDGTLMNPGTAFALPKGESFGVGPAGGYGFVRAQRRGVAGGVIRADLRLSGEAAGVGASTWLDCPPGTTLVTGEAPRLRQAERHDNLLPTFQAPMLCARRQGEDLRSVFVAVHAPWREAAPVRDIAVERLGDAGTLVEIRLNDGGVDWVVIGDDGPVAASRQTALGRLEVEAHWAVVRSRGGAVTDMLVVDGTTASVGETRLAAPASAEGDLAAWGELSEDGIRGWLDLPGKPAVAPGSSLLVTLPDDTVMAFTPVRAEAGGPGLTRVMVRERPAFERAGEGLRLTASPQREVAGSALRWRVLGVGTRVQP